MNPLSEKLKSWAPRLGRYLSRVVSSIPFSLEVDVVRDGVRYRLDLHEHAQRIMYLNLYERSLRRQMMRLLPPGGCVVDVGANVGFWAVQCAQAVGPGGHVYAFEPNPWAIKRLLQNVRLNQRLGPLGEVEVIGAAVGDREGWAELMASDLAAQASQASLYPPDELKETKGIQKVAVPVTRLDGVVKRPVHLLKIDVEGHEMAVLRGAENLFRTTPPDYLVIEISASNLARAGDTGGGLIGRLRELGYAPLDGSSDIFGTMAWKHQRVPAPANGTP